MLRSFTLKALLIAISFMFLATGFTPEAQAKHRNHGARHHHIGQSHIASHHQSHRHTKHGHRAKRDHRHAGTHSTLSKGWTDEIIALVRSGKCRQYYPYIREEVGLLDETRFWRSVAQMMTESMCNPRLVGANGKDKGLFQTQASTCADVGVFGNLFDPRTNTKCALAYLKSLVTRYHFEDGTDGKFYAYNGGAKYGRRQEQRQANTGMKGQYIQKIEFAERQLEKAGEKPVFPSLNLLGIFDFLKN
jgi:hypothetical protein